MLFDDRLATVLRHRAAGERAARTQFRQLLDLLGSRANGTDRSMLAAAWLRLAALGEMIPAGERAAMVGEAAARFRNPELAYHLAEDEPEVAAAALRSAQLGEEDWLALIPRLPLRARGFLRLQRNLPPRVRDALEQLGIQDQGLPAPDGELPVQEPDAPLPPPLPPAPPPASPVMQSEIGALVERIQTYQQKRPASIASEGNDARDSRQAPRLPLGEKTAKTAPPLPLFRFTTDTLGRIAWSDRAVAPMVYRLRLPGSGANEAMAENVRTLIARRQPLANIATTLGGAAMIAGDWIIDAMPRFDPLTGQFGGYAGMFRRPPVATARPDPAAAQEADRLRQLLHELRTPAGAMQGFAEMIQQQQLGPAPHEYRALAAAIAGDGARVLAGFEELDRLAQLESGAMALAGGESDFGAIVARLVEQIAPVLDGREAGMTLKATPHAAPVALAGNEAEALCWRLLATLAGLLEPGEHIRLRLKEKGNIMRLKCALPRALAAQDDIYAATMRSNSGPLRAGMFAAGFSLRLARAEARAAGGDLTDNGSTLTLGLPRLTETARETSQVMV
ncbi:MAG: sensor histidine kinase [Parerythrobacter sp.]